MSNLEPRVIENNLKQYLGDRSELARYASFDYCFNYFHSFHKQGRLHALLAPENVQVSCLQLGFYLASWGMFRGKSQLIKRSMKHYIPVLEAVIRADERIWDLDVDGYDDEAVEFTMTVARQLRASFGHPARDVLVTKVMLGVFACVPAFDTYFRAGFGAQTLGPKSLRRIRAFYNLRKHVIDQYRVATIDFLTGVPTEFQYTGAKVIDMIFFVEGMKKGLAPGD